MGTETWASWPRWSVGPVAGTKAPRRMPVVMARRIQRARRRSRRGRVGRAEEGGVGAGGGDCFSGSEGAEVGREGEAVGGLGTGWGVVGVGFCILVELGFVGVCLRDFV